MLPKRLSLIMTLLIIVGGMSLSACSADHGVELADDSLLPDFAKTAPAAVQESYLFAIANPDALEHQPCYCGCGPMGHDDNLSCFISEIAEDGTITFDTHATGCGICVDIAQDTMRLTAEGKTPAEIREFIDGRYGRFGPPTPTPLPPS